MIFQTRSNITVSFYISREVHPCKNRIHCQIAGCTHDKPHNNIYEDQEGKIFPCLIRLLFPHLFHDDRAASGGEHGRNRRNKLDSLARQTSQYFSKLQVFRMRLYYPSIFLQSPIRSLHFLPVYRIINRTVTVWSIAKCIQFKKIFQIAMLKIKEPDQCIFKHP